MRRVVLPLVALLLAGAATFVARGWLEREPQAGPVAEPASPQIAKAVLVAGTELAVGSFVQPDSLRWQDWPDVGLPDSYYLRGQTDEQALVGAVVRRPLAVGEPLTPAAVVKPGERGFLAAVLDPGMRAISVPIDEAAGNAGLVLPGDRVDLILTQTINAEGDAGAARRVSETVLEDLRVIAMGRRLSSGEGEEAQASRTATLEASPDAVEKVALANELGKLALSLRSLAAPSTGHDGGRPSRLTWDTEASPALRPENQQRTTLTVMRGDKVEAVNIRRGAGS
jgi:pilus assembly protein CpaB